MTDQAQFTEPFPEGLRPDIERFVRATQATFVIGDKDGPAVRWPQRVILMPRRSHFFDDHEYHSTVMHELVHWTAPAVGRERPKKPLPSPDMAREEMVAEMGAAMLCAHFNIEITERHMTYLDRQLDRLPGTNTFELIRAVQAAHRAVHYLLRLAVYTP